MQRSLRRGRRRGLPINAEIQITNLVDVAFVLLIIFMITAPILQGGIELDLPEAESAPLTNDQAITVSVAADGSIFMEETQVGDLREFVNVYSAWQASEPRPTHIRADATAPWGVVAQVMAAIKGLGIDEVSFVLDPADVERR